MRIVLAYLGQVRSLHFDESIAQAIAQSFIASLDDTETRWICLAMLRGLDSSLERHVLPGGLTIRRMPDEEIGRLITPLDPTSDLASNLPFHPFVAEIEQAFSTGDGMADLPAAYELFLRLLRALRIVREGQVDVDGAYVLPKTRCQLESMAYGHPPRKAGFTANGTYILSASDLGLLDCCFGALGRVSLGHRMDTAVARLNFAGARERPDDKLLDLVIALEALYGDGEGAHSYKIALRAAVDSKEEPPRRKDIRDTVHDAYDLRSSMVHGQKRRRVKKTVAVSTIT